MEGSFNSLYQNFGLFGRRGRGPQKGKDIVHKLSVSLEDLYNGCLRKLELEKQVICKTCKGRGGKKRVHVPCLLCQGSGSHFQVHPLLPDSLQPIQSKCDYCDGQGFHVGNKENCTTCNGKKVVGEKIILEVYVDKGMVDGQKITYSGQGNQDPKLEPGDLIIVLDQMQHRLYRRSGNNLILHFKIELVEALCGFRKVIKTLDDRNLFITTIPGKVLKHGDYRLILNEGMPQYGTPLEKGKMFIHFLVNDELPVNSIAQLESCLPARPVETIPENAEEVLLIEQDPQSE